MGLLLKLPAVDNTFTISTTFLSETRPLLSFPQASRRPIDIMVGRTSLDASSMDYTQNVAAADTIIATSELALGCTHSKKTSKRFLIRYRYLVCDVL